MTSFAGILCLFVSWLLNELDATRDIRLKIYRMSHPTRKKQAADIMFVVGLMLCAVGGIMGLCDALKGG